MRSWQSSEWYPDRGNAVPDDPSDWPDDMLEFVLAWEKYQSAKHMVVVPKSHVWHLLMLLGYRKVAEPGSFSYPNEYRPEYHWSRDPEWMEPRREGLWKCKGCGDWAAKIPSPYCRTCIATKCAEVA